MHPEAPSVSAPQTETGELPGGTETILLVEDNPLALDFSQKALGMLGYRVLPAKSGEEAIRLSEEISGGISLLMTDVILPGMDGSTLAEALKKKFPGMEVLYNSGYTENTIVSQGVLHGGLNFIPKPFSTFTLAHKLRKILNRTSTTNPQK
jgi:DNA-binding response OmpR family regulator